MRSHYKTDWHRYNLKRKLRNQPPVSEDVFDELTEVSSIEASDSESDESDDGGERSKVGSPFVMLPFSGGKEKKALVVYKQVLSAKKDTEKIKDVSFILEKLQSFQTSKCWTLLMLGAGHFAGTVIDCKSGKAIVHKTFHRYTTRRKQGGAQSSNDASKGNAKSAGAGLRRYNEQALREEIRALLSDWKAHLSNSNLIFIRAPGASRKTLFYDGGPLDAQDERIRSFPFTTRRPTFGELQRCFKELTTVQIQDIEEDVNGESKQPPAPKPSKAVAKPATTTPDTAIEAEPPMDPELSKLTDAIKRNKLPLFKSLLQSFPHFLCTTLPDGTTLLHLASSSGHPEIVTYLLSQGADPTTPATKRTLRPYDIAKDKETRDAFRRFVYHNPDEWNWKESHIPGPLTPEMEEQQKQKEKEKKKKLKEKQKAYKAAKEKESPPPPEPVLAEKIKKSTPHLSKLTKTDRESSGLTPQQRAQLDREKRAVAAEARMRARMNQCGACGRSLVGVTPFEKFQFRYCSLVCVQVGL